MHDLNGRPWATVAKTKEGSKVEVDGDFTCIRKGEVREVHTHKDGGLYIQCAEGTHLLDGQLSEDKTHYVGLYHV